MNDEGGKFQPFPRSNVFGLSAFRVSFYDKAIVGLTVDRIAAVLDRDYPKLLSIRGPVWVPSTIWVPREISSILGTVFWAYPQMFGQSTWKRGTSEGKADLSSA